MALNFERINRELGRNGKQEERFENIGLSKNYESREERIEEVRMDIKQFREEWNIEKVKQQEEMKKLHQRLKDMQDALENNKLGRPCLYKKYKAEMKKNFENGLSYRELAQKYKCSVSTVYKYVNM